MEGTGTADLAAIQADQGSEIRAENTAFRYFEKEVRGKCFSEHQPGSLVVVSAQNRAARGFRHVADSSDVYELRNRGL